MAHLFTHFVLSLQLALLVLHFHIFTWNVGIVGCKYFSVRVCVCVCVCTCVGVRHVCNMNVYDFFKIQSDGRKKIKFTSRNVQSSANIFHSVI